MRLSINKKILRIHGRFYVVQFGDSLFSIAQRFNTTVEELQAYNDQISHNTLFPGEILFIPNNKSVDTQRKSPQKKAKKRKSR